MSFVEEVRRDEYGNVLLEVGIVEELFGKERC